MGQANFREIRWVWGPKKSDLARPKPKNFRPVISLVQSLLDCLLLGLFSPLIASADSCSRRRRPVVQNKKIFPQIWSQNSRWIYMFQQIFSKKLWRQMLFRIEKRITFVTNIFIWIFMWVIIIYISICLLSTMIFREEILITWAFWSGKSHFCLLQPVQKSFPISPEILFQKCLFTFCN